MAETDVQIRHMASVIHVCVQANKRELHSYLYLLCAYRQNKHQYQQDEQLPKYYHLRVKRL